MFVSLEAVDATCVTEVWIGKEGMRGGGALGVSSSTGFKVSKKEGDTRKRGVGPRKRNLPQRKKKSGKTGQFILKCAKNTYKERLKGGNSWCGEKGNGAR